MVANMTISSHVKQAQHSPPAKGPPHPQKYAWIFKAESSRSPSTVDTGSRSSMIPSPDDSSNSWETRAFAEDASSLAAGIWPPRAYPCSFCRREFRSAQALGGHMNVHRRDRARLRHSSPPPLVPYCPPLTIPQHRALFQAHEKYTVNPATRYLNESLIKPNSPPITLCKSSTSLPTNTPNTSLNSNYYPSDDAKSFPLRLQQLASEAAASLICAQHPGDSSDLLSICPTPTANPARFACHSSMVVTPMKERAMEFSPSSSLSSPPSSNISCARPARPKDATPCRRDAPIVLPEDESPPKRSHTDNTGNCPFKHNIKCRNSLEDGLRAHCMQSPQLKTTTSSSERRNEPSGGDVDLELRLGQKLPS